MSSLPLAAFKEPTNNRRLVDGAGAEMIKDDDVEGMVNPRLPAARRDMMAPDVKASRIVKARVGQVCT